MCGTTGILKKNVRQNWIPIVQSKSGSAAHAHANHNPNPLEPAETALISVTAYRLKSRKIPNPTPSRPDRRRPGKPPIQRRPGRTAAGRENPQTKSASAAVVAAVVVATRESRLCRQKCAVQLEPYGKMCGTTGIL